MTTKRKIRITLIEEMLGTASSAPDVHEQFIASKAPDAQSTAEEVAAIGVDAVVEKGMTIFPRENGNPIMWDYMLKGFFKDACGMLTRAKDTESSKMKAFRKIIDGLVFVGPRKIHMTFPEGGELGDCQRPIRINGPQGERVALANSETVPEGTTMEMDIVLYELSGKTTANLWDCVQEWLDYGAMRGLGQWRNSGKGRFTWELI